MRKGKAGMWGKEGKRSTSSLILCSPFLLFNPFMEPHGHELGGRQAFSSGKAPEHGQVECVQALRHRLPWGTRNLKGLNLVQQCRDCPRVFTGDESIPLAGLLL